MTYDIYITRTAENDVLDAADYIEFELFNPTAADKLLEEVEEKIKDLSNFPEKHQLVDDAILRSWGFRFVAVGNYLIFYIVSDEEKRRYIVRFLYNKRDWMTLLNKGVDLT